MSLPPSSDPHSIELRERLLGGLRTVSRWRESVPAWRARGEAAELLRELTDDRDELQVKLIKRGANRAVYRIDSPRRSLYVKHTRAVGWRDHLRQLFRGSSSRREFDKGRALNDRQVPAARPLAYGERLRRGLVADHFLVTEAIDEAVPLADYLRGTTGPVVPARQRALDVAIAVRLAEVMAAAHRAGVLHDDLHAGNILLRVDGPRAEVYLVDLPGVRVGRPLAWGPARRGLAMLLAAVHPDVDAELLESFWKTYLAARPELARDDLEGHRAQIVAIAQRMAQRMLAGRDGRCWGTNREFRVVKTEHGTAHAVADLPAGLVAALLADPAGPLREFRGATIKLSHSSVVVRAKLAWQGQTWDVAYKRLRPARLGRWLLACLGRNAAGKGWAGGHALWSRLLPTARPLAYLAPRGGRGERYLITQWVSESSNLHLWGWELARRVPDERSQRARQAAARLGELVGRLHAWNLSHRDLKGCNLVLSEAADNVECRLIDLDGLRRVGHLTFERRARDIARLAASVAAHHWVTPRQRLRFLWTYCRQQPRRDVRLRVLAAAVERATHVALTRRHAGEHVADEVTASTD